MAPLKAVQQMYGQASDVLPQQPPGMGVRRRAIQLRDAFAFLIGRVGFGFGASLLLAAGVIVTIGTVWSLGVASVFLVPLAIAAFAVIFAIALILRPVSDGARTWLSRRPLRRTAGTSVLFALRGAAHVVVWWLLRLRAVARRERARVSRHLGADIPIAYRPLPDDVLPTLKIMVADPTTWRDLLYLIVEAAYAFAACLAVGWAWVGAVMLIVLPFAELRPETWTRDGLGWLRVTAGVAGLVLAPFFTYALAWIGTRLGATLLSTGESARMRVELDEQRMRRQLAVDAAEHERRRIERDLHDGAQQRLVALGMTLGLARQMLKTDPVAAAELVDEAHNEAKLAHAELRDLARGIHPAILADRGLDAALSALLRRLPLPVSIIVALPQRPSAAVESAAYFVVSEALTNVSRHAAASRANVSVTQDGETVVVEITDDGVGGADPDAGTGLHGLTERVAALGGRLVVQSPAGGPTTIRAELPCES